MRLVAALSLTVVFVTGTGCAFVTANEIRDINDQIDSDGDGVPDAGDQDCAPTNPDIYPGAVEIVGDGYDNDCADGDLLDADGDGYPVMTEDAYRTFVEAEVGIPYDSVPWNSILRAQADCDDNNIDINPAAAEIYYDGIDSDCGCYDPARIDDDCDDFDQDRDGQAVSQVNGTSIETLARDFYANFPTLQVNVNDPNLFKDCDDSPTGSTVYFGAPDDIPYDQIDTDCAGDNDFDNDGDGYIETKYLESYNSFVEAFHPAGEPAEWAPPGFTEVQTGDCLDRVPDSFPLTEVVAGEVYPGAPDAFADGIDSDCAGDNDFDQDGDGVVADTADLAAIEEYVSNWSGFDPSNLATIDYPDTISQLAIVLGDCDDTNAAVYPGQTEALLNTTVDYDCFGGASGAKFGYGDYLWEAPQHPRMVTTTDNFILGTTAVWARKPQLGGGGVIRPHPAFTLQFDSRVAATSDLLVDQRWDNIVTTQDPRIHGASFDMIADGDNFWLASTFPYLELDNTVSTRLMVVHHTRNPNGYGFVTAVGPGVVNDPLGVDLDLDVSLANDKLWILSSGGAGRTTVDDPPTPLEDGGMRSTIVNRTTFASAGQQFHRRGAESIPAMNGDQCFQSVDPITNTAEFVVCDDNNCEVRSGDSAVNPNFSPIEPSSNTFSGAFREMDEKDGLILLALEGTLGFEILDGPNTYTFLAGDAVLSGDAVWADTTGNGLDDLLFIAAVVEGTPNELRIGWTADPTVEPAAWTVLDVSDDTETFEHCLDGTGPSDCLEVETGRSLEPQRVELAASLTRLGVMYTGTSLDAVPISPVNQDNIPYGLGTTEGGQDAVGWAFYSFYADTDGDGYPGDPGDGTLITPSLLDPDDTDPTITP